MKRKKAAVFMLAAALMAGSFSTVPASADDDIYEIVIEYPTLGTTPADLQMVEDAINEKVEEEIGVHITFYPLSAYDALTTTSLMVSSGEKLDLAISIFEGGVANYVNKGMLLELDDLVEEYGQDIVEAEGTALEGGYFGGSLYGIPSEDKMGRVKAFFARKDLIEKYDIEYDENHIYTADELTEIFQVIQEGEESENPAFHCVAASASEDPLYSFFDQTDQLGASYASGVLMNYGTGNTEIVNYFETEEFENFCYTVREWFESGYLSQDCNTVTDSAYIQTETGNYLGFFNNAEPDMITGYSVTMEAYIGSEMVPFYTTEPSAMTQDYQQTEWMIPITCDNPEKTMQFLNLMYQDQEIVNLLYRGIEGTHYNHVEGTEWVVEYPEGVDETNTTYQAILNVWGDKKKQYVMAPNDDTFHENIQSFNDSIDIFSDALGYSFNTEEVKTQYSAVSDVVTQYQAILGMGLVDPSEELETFRSALEAAGINDCIEANQAQLNEWLASQE